MANGLVRRILQVVTWWQGATPGTLLTTYLHGEPVGTDEFGNRYFRTKGGKVHKGLGFERRWVIYAGEADASTIPPGWYRWMHHTAQVPPSIDGYVPREWEKPHLPNLTGTAGSHHPRGSIVRPDPEEGISAGYDAWTPK